MFLFAGTIYEDPAAGKVVPKVEVRLLGADGKGISTYTDVNGNFFFRGTAGTFVSPAIAGVRNAATAHSMTNKINDGNCNQCHGMTRPPRSLEERDRHAEVLRLAHDGREALDA